MICCLRCWFVLLVLALFVAFVICVLVVSWKCWFNVLDEFAGTCILVGVWIAFRFVVLR